MSYISPEVISDELGVTPKTVREWLKSRALVGIKVGNSWRIHRTDYERYIEGQRLELLLEQAKSKQPGFDWVKGQCIECGEHMVTPSQTTKSWVCSTTCKTNHDNKGAVILGNLSEEHIYSSATVIPYF